MYYIGFTVTPGSPGSTPTYSLLKLEEILLENGETQKLVKLRNPWSSKEWTGAWADGSKEWNMVSKEEIIRIGYADLNDGGFWMGYKERSFFK